MNFWTLFGSGPRGSAKDIICAGRSVAAEGAAFQKADFEAQRMRLVATEQLKHEKKAERLHAYKMKRLDAGDKRNRRKSSFRAACRTYEAIIELLEAKLKCERIGRMTAEAETAAANAEIRVWKLV